MKIVFLAILLGLSFNTANAQCNSGATAGEVSSNSDKICIGSTETFWSTGWAVGGSWSSSNPSLVQLTPTGGNINVKGIASGTVDIIYTVTQPNCSEIKTAKKTIAILGSSFGAVGQISGTSSQCNGSTNQVYTIPAVSGGAVYNWSVPNGNGWTIVSGQNTNSIVVTIGSGNGNISVIVSNTCASGSNSVTRTFNVTVNNNKTVTPTISGNTSLCSGGSVVLTSSDQDNYLWSTGETTKSITVTTAGSYTVKTTKSGSCQSDASTAANVTVSAAPTITPSPSGSICLNTNVQYTTETSKSNYVWSIPGTAGTDYTLISGGTSTSNTATIQWKTAGNKSVTVNYTGGCAPASVTTVVNAAPAITTQPSAPPVTCSGTGTKTITVVATGTGLLYQWRKAGVNLSNGTVVNGATTASLTLTNPTASDAGSYDVVVSGTCSPSVTSNAVTVAVNTAPAITTQPTAPIATCSGSGTQTITVVATGTNLVYVWKKDGTAITNGGVFSGQNSPTLTLTNPTTTNQGNYTVDISGSCTPAVTSNTVAVTVNSAPAITTPPTTPAATCSGSGAQTMTVVASGTGLNYQWRKDGINLTNGTVVSGATSATLTLTKPTASDAGSYDVVVSGTCSPAVTSAAVTVTVYTPTITNAPQAKTCANRHMTYSTQGGKLNYVWSVSGVLNTDYKIIDRGTSTDNYIVIEWLTVGSKTVSVNYTNPSGCSTSTPGTYTTEIVILDKGQVNGGKHICPTETMPTLTFNTYANSSVRYPDTSVIVKWQYSDGNNTNYQDIPGTAGLTSYTPASISGTTRQYRVVVDNGICSDQSIYSAIDIDAATAITSQSTNGQSKCQNDAFSSISVTAVGTNTLTYQWYSTTQNNNTTGSAINGATTNTYTPLSTTAGTLYYYCIVRGRCGNVTSTVSGAFITNAKPTALAASVTAQPTCSGTKGTITITATTGYTYSINGTDYYNQSVFSSLDPGTYTVTAKNASGCISTGTSLQVNPPAAKTWTGTTSDNWSVDSNWSPSGVPTASDCVIIPAGVTKSPIISGTNGNFYAYTLTVNDQGSLTVKSGNTLRVTSSVNVLSSAATAGTLFFENTSSLIQTDTNPNINTGKISYERTTLPIRLADYVYWSSPVQGQTLMKVSSQTSGDKFFSYDGTKWVGTDRTSVMTIGKGYIIRGPQTYSNTTRATYTATFSGVPNNGNLTGETVGANKFYLVGNPYPSALDADTFIRDNFSVLEGTLYFWTHNTPVVLGGAYEYSTDDYATYNLSGSVKTTKAAPSGGNATGNNNEPPSGKIGAGQSFFAGTKAAGTIVFNNNMRGGAADNTQFFKPGKTSKTSALEKNRVWLNMENSGGAFKQLLVGYIEGASNSYESGFDGVSFDGNKYLDFYSVNNGSNFVIQGRALPFVDTDTVPLGYKTTVAGDFTISIDKTDGSMTTQKIYLEDKTTGTIHDLTESNYTFTTATGTFGDRFVLRYTNKSLGTGDFENIENGVLVSVKDKTVKVLSSKENLKEVNIYDISGRLLYNKTKVSANELQIPNLQSSNQVLIVKVTLENEFTVSKKIIFN